MGGGGWEQAGEEQWLGFGWGCALSQESGNDGFHMGHDWIQPLARFPDGLPLRASGVHPLQLPHPLPLTRKLLPKRHTFCTLEMY